MTHNQLFDFESDFVATLRCIPMAVRFKLDRIGIKLSLRQWSRFTHDDRQTLLDAPCATAGEVELYYRRLADLVRLRSSEEPAPLPEPVRALWEMAGEVPPVVSAFARSSGGEGPTNQQWSGLTELQRFVLVKLTRDSHDNVNFMPAMCEFGLSLRTLPAPREGATRQ